MKFANRLIAALSLSTLGCRTPDPIQSGPERVALRTVIEPEAISIVVAPVSIRRNWISSGQFRLGAADEARIETVVESEGVLRVVFPVFEGDYVKRLELVFRATESGTTVEATAQWVGHLNVRKPPWNHGFLDQIRGVVVIPSHNWWSQRALRASFLLVGERDTRGSEQILGEFVIPKF
ncbi:MAG: hypothetical protein K8S98_10445 [Planctomycetes bacterium]|nr:hypothetical protein [Planctomycetota bacterium]